MAFTSCQSRTPVKEAGRPKNISLIPLFFKYIFLDVFLIAVL